MKRFLFIALMIIVPCALFGQNGAGIERTQDAWSLHTGAWNMQIVEEDSAQADSLYFWTDSDGDTCFWSHWFYGWPTMGLHIQVGDTMVAADSFNVAFDLYQYGFSFNPQAADTAKAIFVRTLSWKSHTSSSGVAAITAAGYYAANLTDVAIFPFRYYYIKARALTGNSLKAGNTWAYIVANGWRGAR